MEERLKKARRLLQEIIDTGVSKEDVTTITKELKIELDVPLGSFTSIKSEIELPHIIQRLRNFIYDNTPKLKTEKDILDLLTIVEKNLEKEEVINIEELRELSRTISNLNPLTIILKEEGKTKRRLVNVSNIKISQLFKDETISERFKSSSITSEVYNESRRIYEEEGLDETVSIDSFLSTNLTFLTHKKLKKSVKDINEYLIALRLKKEDEPLAEKYLFLYDDIRDVYKAMHSNFNEPFLNLVKQIADMLES